MIRLMVWFAPSIMKTEEAEDLKACVEKIRRTTNEREVLIVSLDVWDRARAARMIKSFI